MNAHATPKSIRSAAPFWGAALRRCDAAQYLGISPGHFDKLVSSGILPAPRDADGVKVWLRWELDQALAELPVIGEVTRNSADEAFGC